VVPGCHHAVSVSKPTDLELDVDSWHLRGGQKAQELSDWLAALSFLVEAREDEEKRHETCLAVSHSLRT